MVPHRAKTAMTNLDLRALAWQLRSLQGSFVSQVSGDRDRIVLRLNLREGRKADLVIIPGRFVYLVERLAGEQPPPSTFVRGVRKHLRNAYVEAVGQVGFDRLLWIQMGGTPPWRLMIECFAEGNVVLLQGSTIVQVLRPGRWKHRVVQRGEPYVLPPNDVDVGTLGGERMLQATKGFAGPMVKLLAGPLSLGSTVAEEVLLRSGVRSDLSVDQLDRTTASALCAHLHGLLAEVEGPLAPQLWRDAQGALVDVSPLRLRTLQERGLTPEPVPEFCLALATYVQGLPGAVAQEDPQVARLQRQEEQQAQVAIDATKDEQRDRLRAELLYLHYGEVERFLLDVSRLRAQGGWDSVAAAYPGAMVEARTGTGSIRLRPLDDQADPADVEVPLDLRGSVNDNAQNWFQRAKRSKERAAAAAAHLEQTRAAVRTAQAQHSRRQGVARFRATLRAPPRSVRWFEHYHWCLSSTGLVIVGGKDAASNDKVVKRYLGQPDRYCHAEVHGAPSVVVKAVDADGATVGSIDEESLREGAHLSVLYSRCWNAKLADGTGYWVLPDQVSKSPQSGEALARGAFVVRGKRNYVHHLPLRLAIGWIRLGKEWRLMAGPPRAVQSHCGRWGLLAPGGATKAVLANDLSRKLLVPQEWLARLLPQGDSHLEDDHGLLQGPPGEGPTDGPAPPSADGSSEE